MEWTTVKNAKEIELSGVQVEVDRTESSINSVTFTDKDGKKLRVRFSGYHASLDIPAKPKMVEKTVLTGTVRGLPVNEVFDSPYEAERRKEELADGIQYDANLSISRTEVPDEIPF